MDLHSKSMWHKVVRPAVACTLISGGIMALTAVPASAATSATFAGGVLTVRGDNADNNLTVSRNAAGALRVNGGAINVAGGTPTVANTTRIIVIGLDGNDVITLDETNGALPPADLTGGEGNDVLTGGSAADVLVGQGGNDTLLGKGGVDQVIGSGGNDVLTGGTGDDQVFGQGGDDRMVWNPGEGTDLNEGGGGADTVEVNGGNGAEQFSTAANGNRVRFDRVNPAPFSIDIGTSETLVLNANGGDDTFAATGNLAALIGITVDGGTGADTINGSNGVDILLGGDGPDVVDGNQGNDTAFLGDGADIFQWDPGDGNDTVEGQAGQDTMLFNGSNAGENMDASANGPRVRFTRNIGNVTMDLNDLETIQVNAVGGADGLVVNDIRGTAVTSVVANLEAAGGGSDQAADNVIVNGTNGADVVVLNGANRSTDITGLSAVVAVNGATPSDDRVTVNALGGADVVDASSVAANTAKLSINGGNGDDVLIGGEGDDTITGGEDDDVLLGGPGSDVLDGGNGDDIEIDGVNVAARSLDAGDQNWLAAHASTVDGKTVLNLGDHTVTLPQADLSQL